jgi:hypothetical protein
MEAFYFCSVLIRFTKLLKNDNAAESNVPRRRRLFHQFFPPFPDKIRVFSLDRLNFTADRMFGNLLRSQSVIFNKDHTNKEMIRDMSVDAQNPPLPRNKS